MPNKQVYTLSQIIKQLTTSWTDDETWIQGDTLPHTWYDDQSCTIPLGSNPSDTLFYSLNSDFSKTVDTTGKYDGHILMDAAQTTAACLAFQLWDDLVPFSIVEDDTKGPANGNTVTVVYSSTAQGTGTNGELGVAANGNEVISSKHIWFDSTWKTNQDPGMVLGGYGFNTNLHEIGHALGLSHPGRYNYSDNYTPTYAVDAVFAQDNRKYTVMSYFGYYDTTLNGGKGGWTQDGTDWGPDGGTKNGTVFYPQTLMVYDIAAIHAKYGADTHTRADDTTYGFNSTVTGTEKAIYDFSLNAHPIFTIYDAGGYNELDCSGYSGDQTIDLTPGHYSSVDGMTENVAIAFDTTIQEAIGGGGDDTFITGFTTSNYTVNGGAGTNTLDYSWDTTAVRVDVQLGEVFKTGVPKKNIPGGIDTFTNIQEFIGGSGKDTFIAATMVGGKVVNNTFEGGDLGNNTLDESADGYGVTFNLQAGTVDKGALGKGAWKILLGTDHFSDIQTFIAGAGNDTFKGIGDGANYSFDGGAGTNTLDYSLNAARVKIDLQKSAVDKGTISWMSLGTDSFGHFDAFNGSAYNDILVDGLGNHSFNGGNGIDTVELHGWSTDYTVTSYIDFTTGVSHTAVTAKSAGSFDGPLDLVAVEQLHFIDKTVAIGSNFI
jgi:serralysin